MREIVLSKRNLLSLLHKLEMPDSNRTIIKPCGTVVRVETDLDHYSNRDIPSGAMHPDTEGFIAEYTSLEDRRDSLAANEIVDFTKWHRYHQRHIKDSTLVDECPYCSMGFLYDESITPSVFHTQDGCECIAQKIIVDTMMEHWRGHKQEATCRLCRVAFEYR